MPASWIQLESNIFKQMFGEILKWDINIHTPFQTEQFQVFIFLMWDIGLYTVYWIVIYCICHILKCTILWSCQNSFDWLFDNHNQIWHIHLFHAISSFVWFGFFCPLQTQSSFFRVSFFLWKIRCNFSSIFGISFCDLTKWLYISCSMAFWRNCRDYRVVFDQSATMRANCGLWLTSAFTYSKWWLPASHGCILWPFITFFCCK